MRKIDEHGQVYLGARLPAGLAQAFERVAARSGRSISGELRHLIKLSVEEAQRRAQGASDATR